MTKMTMKNMKTKNTMMKRQKRKWKWKKSRMQKNKEKTSVRMMKAALIKFDPQKQQKIAIF